jgi:hypothetical protein
MTPSGYDARWSSFLRVVISIRQVRFLTNMTDRLAGLPSTNRFFWLAYTDLGLPTTINSATDSATAYNY